MVMMASNLRDKMICDFDEYKYRSMSHVLSGVLCNLFAMLLDDISTRCSSVKSCVRSVYWVWPNISSSYIYKLYITKP